MTVIRTAFAYFASVFAFAFAMGVVRTLVVAPLLGEMFAVLIELPIVLATSWVIARHLLKARAFNVAQRLAIGSIALGLTMTSEAALSGFLRGQRLDQWAAAIVTPLGMVGFVGQLGFAFIPLGFQAERSARAKL